MSLDVMLIVPGKDNTEFNDYEMRHLASNFAIACQKGYTGSYDSWFKSIDSSWREIANKNNSDYETPTEQVYSANITHNLGEMAEKAGLYEALWRPHRLNPDYNIPEEDYKEEWVYEENSITYAKDLIEIIEKGLTDLKTRPEYFEQFSSKNGWGMYKNFVPFVEKYLNALKKYPESIVKTDR